MRGSRDHQPSRGAPIRTTTIHRSRSDVLDRLHAVEDYLATGQEQSLCGEINRAAVKTLTQVAKQLANALREEQASGKQLARDTQSDSDEALLRALVAGFPDRVAKRRDATGDKGLMVGGRGVRIGPKSAVQKSPLFLCVDIDGTGSDATVRQASEVLREWLPQSLLRTGDELFFHPTQKQVVARRRVSFDDLVLEETPTAIVDTVAAAEVLYQAAHNQLDLVMSQDDDFSSFVARGCCLRDWMLQLNLPAFDDSLMQEVLRELCHGRRSFSELKSAPWLATLHSKLEYALVQTIEREAPERIAVPSGSRIRLVYEADRPPVLPVRIQEVFGLKQTPRIADGRISVLLHLLAPNMRPQQITDDLASFWANTYPEVRKELKRRYPKHAWPEDPLTAPTVKKG